MIKVGYS